jgi:Tfp pilus assembly protein PilF
MKKLVLVFTLSLSFVVLNAQRYNPATINKKAQQYFSTGIAKAEDGNLTDAVSLLEMAIYTDTSYVDAYLAIGSVYNQQKKYQLAVEYYERAIKKDSVYTRAYKLSYANNLAGKGDFQKALTVINEYISDPKLSATGRKRAEERKTQL